MTDTTDDMEDPGFYEMKEALKTVKEKLLKDILLNISILQKGANGYEFRRLEAAKYEIEKLI